MPTFLLVAMVVVYLAGAIGVGLWITRDARARGSSIPIQWGIAAVVTPIVIPYYLYLRRGSRLGPRDAPMTRTERALRAVGVSVLAALLVATILGPPDPVTQAYYFPGTAFVFVTVALVATFWGDFGTPQPE